MGSVVPLKKSVNSAYLELRNLLSNKLQKVENLIQEKLRSEVNLIQKMSNHHLRSGGKRLRALLTLESAKLTGYKEDKRDINLAACVELIHSATLLHDDVIDESELRRGVKTTNSVWGNQSSILVGDYLLSRCFEMMVEDGDLEVLKLLSSTSSKIAQGEVLQLQHKGEADLLEETYIDIINLKTASLFSAATKTGACLSGSNEKEKKAFLVFVFGDDQEIRGSFRETPYPPPRDQNPEQPQLRHQWKARAQVEGCRIQPRRDVAAVWDYQFAYPRQLPAGTQRMEVNGTSSLSLCSNKRPANGG